ncbi:hypothetical protein [Dyadobacter sp. CY323]|uniref:hypothetical protein n=1 Tax=Dyadobacter sp. CY323 TaxID=2907302 RepID=UPI001F1857DB|nr:hypothetical protein [Dyadobacter sp. CY323]MCE6988868.1 hypothetical protein [Dyadobacter sp. CY323]
MKKMIIYMSVLVLFIITASKCKNAEETNRNSIKFKESVIEVEGSLRVMNKLMDKVLPIKDEMHNYFFDDSSNFYVNNRMIGNTDSLNIGAVKMFRNFTNEEKEEFINKVLFLNNNYLASVFLDKSCKCYLYGYHQVDDPSFNRERLIYLNDEKKEYSTILVDRAILDKKGNLVLVGAK